MDITDLEQAFNRLDETFADLRNKAMAQPGLTEMQAKHPLYEIEPYFAEHNGLTVKEDSQLIIFSEEDFNPKKDQLYTLWMDMSSQQPTFRRWHMGATTYYDTVFEFHEEWIKSATVFVKDGICTPFKMAYLQLQNHAPHCYMEVSKYGALSKHYQSEAGVLLGYEMHSGDHVWDVKFEHSPAGAGLDRIVRTLRDSGRESLVYQRHAPETTTESILLQAEELLYQEISRQMLEKLRITGDKVYCILLEYSIQGAVPPTIGVGLASEYDPDCLLGAADMTYFSEDDSLLQIDLHTEEISVVDNFLVDDYNNLDFDYFKPWEDKIKAMYLQLCQRLYETDFSTCFEKTDNFIVYACDIGAVNDDEYLEKMEAYIKRRSG